MKAWKVIALMFTLVLLSGSAWAEMRLYVQQDALEQGQGQRLLALLQAEFDGEQWTITGEGMTLRELVLSGQAPDLAICAPAEAAVWAKEGLLVPLQTQISGQQRMQRQVLDLCVQGESLFMAPLIARHRQMAVNAALFEAAGLGYMLDGQAYPVWYPAQFYQILEEFLIRDGAAVDVWRAQADSSAAIEALIQAIYGGMLLCEDGSCAAADDAALQAGVQWLRDCIGDGLIGYCETRDEALERFLDGETAMFIDWTQRLQREAAARGLEIVERPYPTSVGLPVRSFDLTGVCAFASGEAIRDSRLGKACACLHENAQDLLGSRGIWQDGAIWPASLEDGGRGATLRSLFDRALFGVIEEGAHVRESLERVQAAMDALDRTK